MCPVLPAHVCDFQEALEEISFHDEEVFPTRVNRGAETRTRGAIFSEARNYAGMPG